MKSYGYIYSHLLFWIKCLNSFDCIIYEYWMYTAMATKMSVSYRRNRDYTKQFDWTYDLNCDLYNYYTKAKDNPTIGYMKRMKQNWDIIDPKFSHLSDKNLRDHASRIIKNKIVMETQFSVTQQTVTHTGIRKVI